MLRTAGLLALHDEDFVSGLQRRGCPRPEMELRISSPLSYPAAGTLPGPDFHRQAHHSLFWTHSFPNASVGNLAFSLRSTQRPSFPNASRLCQKYNSPVIAIQSTL